MNRPSTHGGGKAAPPIAGDVSSFPRDAELARNLVANRRTATLSTLTSTGYPYGSVVSYAADDEGSPVILISEMAEHTVNAKEDARASMLIADVADEGDPLGRARLTLVGTLENLDEPGIMRDQYLTIHPQASYYADFTDFGFWQLNVEECRFVGGFGHMSWVTADEYRDSTVDPISDHVASAIEHMNEDHTQANLEYVIGLTELDDATAAELVGLDRHGLTLKATTPEGPRMARVAFPEPLTDADQIRPAVIDLLAVARGSGSQ